MNPTFALLVLLLLLSPTRSPAGRAAPGLGHEPPRCADAPAAQTRFETGTYSVSFEPHGPAIAGQPIPIVATVTPKASYHVNVSYPHRLMVVRTTGVRGGGTVGAKRVSTTQLEIPVRVVPSQAGPVSVVVELRFGLCTETHCTVEKRLLETTFTAQAASGGA